jgi:hypothetical protein
MEHVIFIMSHNSKEMTSKVYDALSKQSENVFVLENSYIEEERFSNENTIDLGEENIGVGGFYDYICEYAKDKENIFIGIFNNDISGIDDNFMDVVSKYFKKENGIVHPSLNDKDCPYPQMSKNGENFRYVNFVENVVPFYNVDVLKVLSNFTPLHYYGWLDGVTSKISQQILNLHNVVIDETTIEHERGGVRKKMESIDSNYSKYSENAEETWEEWMEKHKIFKIFWWEGIYKSWN